MRCRRSLNLTLWKMLIKSHLVFNVDKIKKTANFIFVSYRSVVCFLFTVSSLIDCLIVRNVG